MKTCEEVQPSLWEYYDDQVEPRERDLIEDHLAGCSRCQEILSEWRTISSEVLPSSDIKAPPYLWTRIRAAIEQEEPRMEMPWYLQWRWMIRLTAGTAAIIGLGAFYLWQETPLEPLLQGQPASHSALQLADAELAGDDAPVLLALGE